MIASLSPRERVAVGVFAAGAIVLFAAFVAGALLGKSAATDGPAANTAQAEPAPGIAESTETVLYLVEAGVFDSPAAGEEALLQLRRQYTSAWGAIDPDDRRYHVYAGPYPQAQAETVAAELRSRGRTAAAVRPFSGRQPAQ